MVWKGGEGPNAGGNHGYRYWLGARLAGASRCCHLGQLPLLNRGEDIGRKSCCSLTNKRLISMGPSAERSKISKQMKTTSLFTEEQQLEHKCCGRDSETMAGGRVILVWATATVEGHFIDHLSLQLHGRHLYHIICLPYSRTQPGNQCGYSESQIYDKPSMLPRHD